MSRWIDGAAIVIWNCFAWTIWAAAIVEVLRTPADQFLRRWRTKSARLVVIALGSASIAGIYLPVGAAIILAGLRRSRPTPTPTLPPTPGIGPGPTRRPWGGPFFRTGGS